MNVLYGQYWFDHLHSSFAWTLARFHVIQVVFRNSSSGFFKDIPEMGIGNCLVGVKLLSHACQSV